MRRATTLSVLTILLFLSASLCGRGYGPKRNFHYAVRKLLFKNIVWNNQKEGYGAEELITLDNCTIKNANDIQFKVGEKILLTNNTHIYPGNSVHFSYGGNFCFFSKKEKSEKNQTSVDNKNSLDGDFDTASLEDVKIYPNPNTGSFEIQSNFPFGKEDVQIFDILGNKLDFRIYDNSVHLLTPFNGIIFLHLHSRNKSIVKKLMINEK